MYLCLLLADWAKDGERRESVQGEFSDEEVIELNAAGFNVYYWPNSASNPPSNGRPVKGRDIDTWSYVFADMDLKDKKWASKEDFIKSLDAFELKPTSIVDSGRGVHVYWRVTDLSADSFIRLQRRLARRLATDPEVFHITQLMRMPGTVNVKDPDPDKWVACEVLDSNDVEYDCQTLDRALPRITVEDEAACKRHWDKTFLDPKTLAPNESAKLPPQWGKFLRENKEAAKMFAYNDVKDRSAADYRLGHLLLASGLFTKEEARAVLMNTGKALSRTSVHQYNYANDIVEKIWEVVPEEPKPKSKGRLSKSVAEIMRQSADAPRALRFECHPAIDATVHGYRLGEVLGLIGGAGAGKTTFCLNMFRWFWERNPNYIHIFVSLEQPEDEIADRWSKMVKSDPRLSDRVHIIGNYNDDGTFRNLSMADVEAYIMELQQDEGIKVGAVVVDHIAIVRQDKKASEEMQRLVSICMEMKPFAVRTNTFLVMQSQTSREKAGIGDLELDKNAAYGTSYFEFYCDYIVTTWQPLKRLYGQDDYAEKNMYINCWKYCKIRHKKANEDRVQEDQVYAFKLDLDTDKLTPLLEDDHEHFTMLSKQATALRNKDKKSNPAPLKVISWTEPVDAQGTNDKST